MKKNILVVFLILTTLFCGCSGKVENMDNTFNAYYKADKKYDERSIYYKDGVFKFVKDKLDSKNIRDGRSGEYRLATFKSNNGFFANYPETKWNKELLQDKANIKCDDEKEFIIQNSQRCITVEKLTTNWEESKKNYLDEFQNKDVENVTDTFKSLRTGKYIVFYGIVEASDGKKLIGLNSLIEYNNSVYKFSYSGYGIFDDIIVDADAFIFLPVK